MSDTVKVLQRLKRKFGRERARLDRLADDETGSPAHRARCVCEASQWHAAMTMLDEEIRKAKP